MILCALSALLLASSPTSAEVPGVAWGYHGHGIAGRAAAAALPDALPSFFRDAARQLEYLNPEPDRWRDRDLAAMDEAWNYDHYIDLENVPEGALEAPDRWSYLDRVYGVGLENPVRDTGFLPYRMLELYQRLVAGWRLWRDAPAHERPWIEERIVWDAGILGHYVTDASQPHHTTIHFNGWSAGEPNPGGFTTDRGFHGRFESAFVETHVTAEDVLSALRWETRTLADPWSAILAHIQEAHDRVPELYRLDRDVGFAGGAPAHPDAHAFAVERLAAGADMLRDLWWSAWVESGGAGG
ncbi:MAG: hypothetical protein KY453_06040 [Gemmatimonadetes bacterium]|nr:hypothetical protein [Gemmatimonadota bacterium]